MSRFYITWENAWGAPRSRGFRTLDEALEFAKSANLTKFKIVG